MRLEKAGKRRKRRQTKRRGKIKTMMMMKNSWVLPVFLCLQSTERNSKENNGNIR